MGLLEKAAAIIKKQMAVRTKITGYCQSNPDSLGGFQGILLENSNAAFAKQVAIMVGALGLTLVLSSSRFLILLPLTLDRELIAHRLSISLCAEVLICFAADNPDKALELIQPYW
jgi:hypothetical protein